MNIINSLLKRCNVAKYTKLAAKCMGKLKKAITNIINNYCLLVWQYSNFTYCPLVCLLLIDTRDLVPVLTIKITIPIKVLSFI